MDMPILEIRKIAVLTPRAAARSSFTPLGV